MNENLSDEELRHRHFANPAASLTEEQRRDLYREFTTEMRSRRETDMKLITIHFAMIGVSMGLLFQTIEKSAIYRLLATAFTIAVVLGFWRHIQKRVEHDHKVYEALGARVVWILEAWETIAPALGPAESRQGFLLPAETRDFGKGHGYRTTLKVSAIASKAFFITAIGILISSFLTSDGQRIGMPKCPPGVSSAGSSLTK